MAIPDIELSNDPIQKFEYLKHMSNRLYNQVDNDVDTTVNNINANLDDFNSLYYNIVAAKQDISDAYDNVIRIFNENGINDYEVQANKNTMIRFFNVTISFLEMMIQNLSPDN